MVLADEGIQSCADEWDMFLLRCVGYSPLQMSWL
jgi:hypothetical protein